MENYEIIIIIIIMVFLILLLFYIYIIPLVAQSMMYHPYKATRSEYDILSKRFGRNEEFVKFLATDKTELTGFLINYHKNADWNDIIFLYSHGNGAWIGGLLNSPQIDILSKFGSVFVYDYRQYGLSSGSISEKGTYSDIMGAWLYLTIQKNIPPDKIIVYGHSVGGAISTKLISMLIENNKELPLALILDGTFSSIVDMGNHLFPGLGIFSPINYNNVKNLQHINGSLPVLVMHSQDDEVVPYDQSLKIKENCKCKHIKIKGNHCAPIFNKEVFEFIDNVIDNIIDNDIRN